MDDNTSNLNVNINDFMNEMSIKSVEYKPTPASTHMDKRRNRIEFSKKILIYAGIINTIVILSTLYVVIATYNTQPLVYLIPSVAAEVSAGTIFYYRKSSMESTIKLFLAYGVPITENLAKAMLDK